MRALGFVLLILLAIFASVGLFILAVWVVVWNVSDIQNVGINFWNAFWLVLVALGIAGVASRD